MRRRIFLGASFLCFVVAIALAIFAAILYRDNSYEKRLDDEYFRRGYSSTESNMTTANWAVIGLSVVSGATGVLCLVGAIKTKLPAAINETDSQ
jgi:anaerobic C4-dicarboxylate transporter